MCKCNFCCLLFHWSVELLFKILYSIRFCSQVNFLIFSEDDKFGRRERYAGPTSEFKDKEGYKPNVKLDYIDDEGHVLNAKEAFR